MTNPKGPPFLPDEARIQALSLVVHELNNMLGETFMAIEDLGDSIATNSPPPEFEIAMKSLNVITDFLRSIAYVFSGSQRRTSTFLIDDALNSLNKIVTPLIDKKKSTLSLDFPNGLMIDFQPGFFCSVLYDLIVSNNDSAEFHLKLEQQGATAQLTASINSGDRSWTNADNFLAIFPDSKIEGSQLKCTFQCSAG